ncbi:MAG: alkaline phosphatase D family protein [Proteobacteria bacterium]|nr:alkaline phosphatase D family protein [Pseudomonadota bacterium]
MATPLQVPDRRRFLQQAGWAALATQLPRWAWAGQPLRHDPFGLGVASGEPLPDGVVLWTRLLPPDPADAGAPWAGPLTVRWEVADDPQFRRIVHHGNATALPDLAHSVHVEVRGLQPGRWYHYRFMLGHAVSSVGRTRTAPASDVLAPRLRLVQASCQRWEHGYYAAWRHARADEPDLILFLGDYIYEYATPKDTSGLARTHNLHLPRNLADYRARYALHKSDPDLQAAHACAPWVVTWDDHEVLNDYVGTHGRGDAAEWLPLRAAAWQAFYEHMPLRASTLVSSSFQGLQIYRHLAWGRLARLHVLDARQYRDLQACRKPGTGSAGAVRPESCAELADPQRSFLGWQQEQWLQAGLAQDAHDQSTRWSVLAQQTLFAPRHYPSGVQSTDSWDGYPAARQRLLQALAQQPPRNTVLLGGDIHQNYVCNVTAQPEGGGSARTLASEFCGTSISSRAGTTQDKVDAIRRNNPHVLLARCDERGYGLCDISPKLWTTQLRAITNPLDPASDAYTLARFVVEDGRPGPQPA